MSKQIFILSSDRQLARNTASYLKLKGYSVHTFCDPQEAIVGADTTRPDLAIIELSLAGRSGIEFLYELRSYPDWQSLPVIVLGHQHLADIEPYLNAFAQLGVSQYLSQQLTSLPKLHQEISSLLQTVLA